MVRDPRPSSQVRLPRHPWAGIALSDACGKVLCDMSKNGWRDGHDGVATMHVELDPGVYVLRVDTSVAGVRKMAVAVCPGWQTQVLLATGQYRRSGKDRPSIVRRALLSDAAVFMVKPDATGDPWQFMEKQLRLTELARQGLAQGRAPIRPSDLQDMLWAKYENPMLGIIGAHLLLRTPEPDLNMLHTVVGNLERIVSGHPDVLALRLAVDTRRNVVVTEAPVCAVPPMLSASWQIIVEQSIKWPHLVPPGSLADRIGYGNLSGTPWLVWRRERLPAKANNNDGGKRWIQPPSAMRTRCSVPGRETGGEILSYLTSTYLSPLPLRQSQADSHQKTLPQLLADVHERFPTNISKSGADLYPSLPPAQRYLLQEVAIQSASGKSADPDQVVRRLGVPVTTVIGMAKDLLRRGGHPGNAVGRMG